jgi:hypothetical protein
LRCKELLDRLEGRPAINILTSGVEPLGLEVVAASVAKGADAAEVLQALMLKKPFLAGGPFRLQNVRKKIQTLVSQIVIEARLKDSKDLFSANKEFPVFLCGGGQVSKWYTSTILGTHSENQHWRCGVPRNRRESIGVPDDLTLNGLQKADCHRHLVAYGLSFLHGQGPEVTGFPKDNQRARWGSSDDPDAVQETLREKYGKTRI